MHRTVTIWPSGVICTTFNVFRIPGNIVVAIPEEYKENTVKIVKRYCLFKLCTKGSVSSPTLQCLFSVYLYIQGHMHDQRFKKKSENVNPWIRSLVFQMILLTIACETLVLRFSKGRHEISKNKVFFTYSNHNLQY